MDDKKLKLIIGSMLHDVGKLVYRTNDIRKHSISGEEFVGKECKIQDQEILDCIRHHHYDDFKGRKLDDNNLAFISYIADNIASSADRRQVEETGGFNKKLPLYSIFNILNGNNSNGRYKLRCLNNEKGINYPIIEEVQNDEVFYKEILDNIKDKFKQFILSKDYVQSFSEILEGYLTYVPSSTNLKEIADISLYDHLKLTAAFACCIYDYFKENKLDDYSKLLTETKKYYSENIFYLYSLDMSGIQNYIYTISSKGALKSLRTRSFYLEIFLENIIDTILEELELTRMNLIYSGGGHCYFILPNTEKVKTKLDLLKNEINNWLIEKYGIELYLAGAGVECNKETFDYNNVKAYKELFRELSHKMSKDKLNRYTNKQLLKLNYSEIEESGRECKICHKIEEYVSDNSNNICFNCQNIIDFSRKILTAKYFVVEENKYETSEPYLELPQNRRLIATSKEELLDALKDNEYLVRAYTKNDSYSGEGLSTKLWVGDYAYDNELKIFSEGTDGIKRLGVIRADVDNLGQAFVSGFENEKATLTRSAVFSRSMSMFFKYHINYVLENGQYSLKGDTENKRRKALIVYSGGDDLFIVGAWNDIIEFSVDLVDSLEKFTLGSLKLSAGIGIFDDKYPIKLMAQDTGELEESAKDNKYEEEGVVKTKNSVCIFDKDLRFSWKEFKEKIVEEKLKVLIDYFGQIDDRGKAFLYKILDYLREIDDKINLARLAYLLSRLEPTDKSKIEKHQEFSKIIYKYALNKKDRMELITAIYIYVYLERR